MRIAIVSTATDPTTGARLLEKSARAAGHEVRVSLFEGADRAWLASSDICIVRVGRPTYRRVIEAASFYEQHNPQGLMSVSSWGVEHSFDKYLSYETLRNAGIATPETFLIESRKDVQAKQLEQKLPLIMKPLNHNGGKGITVAYTADELHSQVAYLIEQFGSGVVQHFFVEARGKDIRAFVIGGAVAAAMERTAPEGSVIANLTQGGSAKVVTLDDDTGRLAIAACKAFGAAFAGVDLLLTERGATVLEVNISPGFALADIANVDLSAKIIDYLTEEKVRHD